MLDHLYQQISDKSLAGEDIPLSWLYEQRRLEALTQFIEGQINQFGMLAQMQTGQLQHMAVQIGQQTRQRVLQTNPITKEHTSPPLSPTPPLFQPLLVQ